MTAYRSNSRNILGTDANGDVVYATTKTGIDRGNNYDKLPPAPEPVAERYCLTFFDADDNLLTDWYTATSAEDAMEQAEAVYGLGIDYHAHETEPLPAAL